MTTSVQEAAGVAGPRHGGSLASLSLFDATMLVMGGVIGVGIFFTPQAVARLVPHQGAFLAAWVVGGVIALAGAMTFAELAGMLPRAGGWFVYLREAFGRFPAFLFAWVTLLVISTGAVAIVADFCSQQVATLAFGSAEGHDAARLFVGAIVIAVLTVVCLAGVKPGAIFQDAVMILKLGAVATLVIGGLALAAGAGASGAAVAAGSAPLENVSLAGFTRAMLPVLFAYGGWQLVTYVAPNVREPQRNIPRALVAGMAGVVAVYLLVNLTYVHVLGIEGLATEPGFAASVARHALGATGRTFLVAAMAASSLGICAAILLATPALYVAMAREGLFFSAFGRVHPRTGAPVAAIVVQGMLTLAYFFWGKAGPLTDAVVFAEWIFHALCGAALLTLHRTRKDLPRPFASPAHPLFPLVYTILAAAVVVGSLLTTEWRTTRLGLLVLLAGVLVYRPWQQLVARKGLGTR